MRGGRGASSIATAGARWALAFAVLGAPAPALAGKADVLEVHATCTTIRTCDFQVKVLHADVGTSHYADRFEIVAPDGEVLGTRILHHPHVHEQPFVRGLVGVEIPEGVSEVVVRARDSKHGLGGRTLTKSLEFPAPATGPAEPGREAKKPPGEGDPDA